jgi:hypothetical protein
VKYSVYLAPIKGCPVSLKRAWSESDIERLKAMVTSGASALRASIALKRSLAVTSERRLNWGVPFDPIQN